MQTLHLCISLGPLAVYLFLVGLINSRRRPFVTSGARDMAARLGVPLAIIEKRRVDNADVVESLNIIGDVDGRTAIAFDDEIDTGGTLIAAVDALQKAGVKDVYACCTHPVLSGPGTERVEQSLIKELVVTDTLPLTDDKRNGKITVLPVASLLGEAIRRIHEGLSVGAMFE